MQLTMTTTLTLTHTPAPTIPSAPISQKNECVSKEDAAAQQRPVVLGLAIPLGLLLAINSGAAVFFAAKHYAATRKGQVVRPEELCASQKYPVAYPSEMPTHGFELVGDGPPTAELSDRRATLAGASSSRRYPG